MTGTLKSALAISLGVHTGLFFGWPTTTPVQFDVERAPTSIEIRLVAPRADPITPQALPERPIVEVKPKTTAEVVQEPDPVPQIVVAPEIKGALTEVLPGYLRNPAPIYPLLSRQRGEEGTVLLKTEVLPTGRTGQLTILSSSGFLLLDEAASEAVRKWQFKPAKRGNNPVTVWVEIPITFQLIPKEER